MMQGIFWKYIRRCAVALLLAAGIFAVGLLSAKRTHGAAVQRTAALHGVEPVSGRSAAPAAGASGPAADDSTRGTAAADKAAGRNQPQVRAELSADTVLIGHRFKLRVEVTKDVMQMVAFPEFENGRLTDSLEILLEGPVDTVSREGRTARARVPAHLFFTCRLSARALPGALCRQKPRRYDLVARFAAGDRDGPARRYGFAYDL